MMVFRIINTNPKLKPAIRVTITKVTRGANPSMNGNADFTDCAENELNINLGEYKGSLSEARATIQEFCNQYEVIYKGLGLGYANLYIDGQVHELTPYHIDINMMLEIIAKQRAEPVAPARAEFQLPKLGSKS